MRVRPLVPVLPAALIMIQIPAAVQGGRTVRADPAAQAAEEEAAAGEARPLQPWIKSVFKLNMQLLKKHTV